MTSLESVYDSSKSFLNTYVDSTDQTKVDAGIYVPKSVIDILFISNCFRLACSVFTTLFLTLVPHIFLKWCLTIY